MFGMAGQSPSSLRCLFVDLNAYFASVEQELRPELRGRPVAVVPVMTDSTCCIAASYEARPFGIRTGTGVGEARRLCPDLVLVEARHDEYVRFHHRIIAAIDTCIPIESIRSIDEMSCRLLGAECEPATAFAIAQRIKRAIADQVGGTLRCSIGIASNRFLAKVASDMRKPDGLVTIERSELPRRLHPLDLRDLPGIGPRMERRLQAQGIRSVEHLCGLSEAEMMRAWNGIVGRMWYRWLRGDETDDAAVTRRSVGHQHVLPPSQRNDHDAFAVAARLLQKAAARMRRLHYWAGRLTLTVRAVSAERDGWGGGGWSDWRRLGATQDTLAMTSALRDLWRLRPRATPLCVGVTLSDLVGDRQVTLPLFEPEQRRTTLARMLDRLHLKYGRNLVYSGAMWGAEASAPRRIAFHCVPDVDRDF